MKIRPRRIKSSSRKKRELLREFFQNAITLALAKEAVLVPARGQDVPAYFRG